MEDYFEVTAVIDENKTRAKGITVEAVIIAIDRVAAEKHMTKVDSGQPNAVSYRIDMDDPTSLAYAGMLANILYEPWMRQYLSALTLYDSYEDELEDVIAELDDFERRYGRNG